MIDIVERLCRWTFAVDAPPASDLMDEAADEIQRLRQVAEQKNMTDSERDVLREVCRVYADEDDVGCNEIAFVLDRLLERLGAANSPPNPRKDCGECLTDAERAAVEWAALALGNWADERIHAGNFSKRLHKTAATLRKLLKRLSPPAT